MLIDQAKGRVGAELDKAKDYKEAYESGDPDKLVEAQENLSKLHNENLEWISKPQQLKTKQEPLNPKLLSFHKRNRVAKKERLV